ncbi:CAP domain-containing protein [Salinithrix halophila]|uniref:CAP domain-containing protein n=1 Tax=Salinithrix halophila TaxID=1485204 RepID=A0ABV8JEB0_9BACL
MKKSGLILFLTVLTFGLVSAGPAPTIDAREKGESLTCDRIVQNAVIGYQMRMLKEENPSWFVTKKPKKVTKKKKRPKAVQQPTDNRDKANSSGNQTPSTTPSTGSNQPSSMKAIEREVVQLVNQERAKNRLKPLRADGKLSSVARDKSKDMIANNYFSHDSPTYGSPFDMMKRYGIRYSTAAENIAGGQSTAKKVMEGWMNSEGHRANILNPDLTTIGVGYARGGSYGHYWTQMFIAK